MKAPSKRIGGPKERAKILLGICLGIPILLWLLPVTRWAVVSSFRRAFGTIDWQALGMKPSDGGDAWSMPDFYGERPAGSDREATLTWAANVAQMPKLTPALAAARLNPDDVLFQANYLLLACQWVPMTRGRAITRDNLEWNAKMRAEHHGDWLAMREACDQASRLEPGNAFFPVVAGAASNALGDRDASLRYLAEAGRRPDWNDHAGELTAIYRRTMLRAFGYRGWEGWGYLAVPSAPWWRDLFFFSVDIAKLPLDSAGIQARQDMIHVADLAYRTDQSSWGDQSSAYGASLIVAGLADYGTASIGDFNSKSREQMLGNLAEISRKLAPQNPAALDSHLKEMLAAFDFAGARGSEEFRLPPDPYEQPTDVVYIPYQAYGIGAMALAGLASLLALMAVSFALGRLPERLLPVPARDGLAVTGLLAWMIPLLRDGYPEWALVIGCFAGFFLLVGCVSLAPRLRKLAVVAGSLLPLPAVLILSSSEFGPHWYELVVIPAVAFIILWIRQWFMRAKEPSTFPVAPLLLTLLFGWTAVLYLGPFPSVVKGTLAFSILAVTLVTIVASWQGAGVDEACRQIRAAGGWIGALASVCFAVCIVWQVDADRHQLELVRQEESISGVLRTWAHEHPDGLLAQMKSDEAKGITHGGWP
ncbi:MAG: hypothetical protein ACHQ50_08885 [Fimbriimonadales bacterium]